jgi:uncharacterized linocin/CFP29 family protein
MDFLSRGSAPFSEELWAGIDGAVVDTAKKALIGRRFLSLYGPLGSGALSVPVDDLNAAGDEDDGAMVRRSGRAFREIPLLYRDFQLSWRDLEFSEKNGLPLDLTAASAAAAEAAKSEDRLIFFGSEALGVPGLFGAKDATHLKRGDWSKGETPFADVAKAVELLIDKGFWGRMALVVSPNLYAQMQRIQPAVGRMEIERVAALLEGRVLRTPVLGANRAVLVAAEPINMDLALGVDFSVSYLELKDLNHSLRIVETVLPRIKRGDAIVVFD